MMFMSSFLSTPARWNFFGASLLLLGAGLTALSNALLHGHLVGVPAVQVLFIKSFCAGILCLPFLYQYLNKMRASSHIHWHVLKAFLGALGNYFWIQSLKILPFAEATTLSLTSALLTSLGAWFFFKESFRIVTGIMLSLGFCGVFIALAPAFEQFDMTILLPIGSAICFTGSSLLVKKVSVDDPMPVSLMYLLFTMALISAPFATVQWQPLSPFDVYILISLSILYIIVQWALIDAYTYATASFLAPFKFARFPFGVIIGGCYFGETIGVGVILGGSLIFISCILVNYTKNDPSVKYTASR